MPTGRFVVCHAGEVRSELLAVFRDDMLQTERVPDVIHNAPPGVWVKQPSCGLRGDISLIGWMSWESTRPRSWPVSIGESR